jgi:hypothetical protein
LLFAASARPLLATLSAATAALLAALLAALATLLAALTALLAALLTFLTTLLTLTLTALFIICHDLCLLTSNEFRYRTRQIETRPFFVPRPLWQYLFLCV